MASVHTLYPNTVVPKHEVVYIISICLQEALHFMAFHVAQH